MKTLARFLSPITDLPRLFYPIRGGYRILVPHVKDRAWPILFVLASAYRRLFLRKVRFIVVVGSVGKTTAKRAIDRAIGPGAALHNKGNYGVALAMNVLRTKPTDRFSVCEVGIAGTGRMASYARMLKPDIVVATTVKSDHNRSLPTLEDTRREKVKMVQALRPGGLAVLNGDDPHVLWMATQTRARITTYGFSEENAVRALDYAAEWPGGSFRVRLPDIEQPLRLRTRLLGRHMAYPLLAATLLAHEAGIAPETIGERLATLEPATRRLQPVTLPNGATLVCDDFKGSLESFDAAFEAFSTIQAKRRVLVLADVHEPPGQQGPMYRDLGARVAALADFVVLIGSESLLTLRSGAVRAGMKPERVRFVGARTAPAIELLQAELRPGDGILLKGTGSRRLERITLALSGRTVRCNVSYCKIRVNGCESCPLVRQEPAAFENFYVRLLTRP